MSFAICYATKFGLGSHEDHIRPSLRDNLDKADYAFEVLYVRLCSVLAPQHCG